MNDLKNIHKFKLVIVKRKRLYCLAETQQVNYNKPVLHVNNIFGTTTRLILTIYLEMRTN